jgi:hypothetical protein
MPWVSVLADVELDQQLWKELGLCGKIFSSKVNVYPIAEWLIQVNVKCYDDWVMRLMTRDRLKYRKWIWRFLAGSGDLSFSQSARYILLNWGKRDWGYTRFFISSLFDSVFLVSQSTQFLHKYSFYKSVMPIWDLYLLSKHFLNMVLNVQGWQWWYFLSRAVRKAFERFHCLCYIVIEKVARYTDSKFRKLRQNVWKWYCGVVSGEKENKRKRA